MFTGAAWPAEIRTARREGSRREAELTALPPILLPPLRTGGSASEPSAASDRLAAVWRSTLLESLPAVCVAVANARAALAAFRPKVLVVGNDITIEGRAAALLARAAKVPVVVMMHGHVGTNNPLHGVHLADRLVAYGDAHRRALVALGIAGRADPRLRRLALSSTRGDRRPPGTIDPAIGEAAGDRARAILGCWSPLRGRAIRFRWPIIASK